MAKVVLVGDGDSKDLEDKLFRSELSFPTARRVAHQYNENKPYDSQYRAIAVADSYQLQ